MTQSPWLSVVTVVKNDPEGLERSLASMRLQDRSGVEYLVIDSSDDASEVPELLARFSDVESTHAWLPPAGIYPAMNAGVERASGEYLYFLNAGDSLAAAEVLAQVHSAVAEGRPGWLFGQVEIAQLNGARIVTPSWDYPKHKRTGFSRGFFPPHQGTFAQAALVRSLGGFDTSYRIAADYALFLKLARAGDPLILDLVIASFIEGGASTIDWKQSFREFHRARLSILNLGTSDRIVEQINTTEHFLRVWLVREVLPKVGVSR